MGTMTNATHLPCGHRITRKEHGFVSTDGLRLHDSQTCLDRAEGRTPQKFGRDEDRDEAGGKTWEGRGR